MESLGQLLQGADKQNQYDTDSCPCGNKTERSLQSAPPIFAVGTATCFVHNFYLCYKKEKKQN